MAKKKKNPAKAGKGKRAIRHHEVVGAFGARLRELRLARGLKQRELAKRASTDSAYIGRIERGTTAASIDLVARLAEALAVPISELFPAAEQDAVPLLEEQARRRFDSIMKLGDPATLAMVVPLLSVVDDSLARRRR